MKTSIFVALALAATACGSIETVNSDQVSKQTIYRSYTAEFNQETNELNLLAQFRVGGPMGTTLRLKDPSHVTVENEAMNLLDGDRQALNIAGSFYLQNSKVSALKPAYHFVWTSDDKVEITDTVEFPLEAKLVAPEPGATISNGKDITIAFESEDLHENEEVLAEIETQSKDVKPGQSSLVLASTKSGKTVLFTANEIKKLPLGRAKLHIEKSRRIPIESDKENSGGSLNSKVKYQSIAVTIAD